MLIAFLLSVAVHRGQDDPNQSEAALDGLQQVMAVKSCVVLPYLIPQLVCHPVNSRALSLLTSAAGDELTRHLGKILPALISSLCAKKGTEAESQVGFCSVFVAC